MRHQFTRRFGRRVQYANQNEVTTAVLKAAEAGTAATEEGSLPRHRLTEMRDFYNFLLEEIPAVLDRWHQRSAPATKAQT